MMVKSLSMPQLDISISYNSWLEQEPQEGWQNFFESILSLIKVQSEEISLSLVDDSTIQKLNSQFRGKDSPTNVLAFPSTTPEICLGDIVLSFETIQNEAIAQGKIFLNHVTHLFVHGLLHLMGYDHVEEDERAKMEEKEIQILEKLGIGNPYVS